MRQRLTISLLLLSVTFAVSFSTSSSETASLRSLYAKSPAEWPAPYIDTGVQWKELGILPPAPIQNDSLKHLVELGRVLFFDPRLSGSLKISCASCHQPQLSWTDGKDRSLGHEGQRNKRNAPSIQNSWFYQRLFWDGRSSSLEDQAFAPINSESEMHGDIRELPTRLRRINGYPALFDSAYGDPAINPDRIAAALAGFQRTIISRPSRLDSFLAGNKNVLNKAELRGLHLFRTQARCINCHNGPMLTDNLFHNNGFAGEDKGFYSVTHKDEDAGKMKTPSLRDVMKTGPWMHDGSMTDMATIIERYNQAEFPAGEDRLLKPLHLSPRDKKDLLAFLYAVSSEPATFRLPVLPQ